MAARRPAHPLFRPRSGPVPSASCPAPRRTSGHRPDGNSAHAFVPPADRARPPPRCGSRRDESPATGRRRRRTDRPRGVSRPGRRAKRPRRTGSSKVMPETTSGARPGRRRPWFRTPTAPGRTSRPDAAPRDWPHRDPRCAPASPPTNPREPSATPRCDRPDRDGDAKAAADLDDLAWPSQDDVRCPRQVAAMQPEPIPHPVQQPAHTQFRGRILRPDGAQVAPPRERNVIERGAGQRLGHGADGSANPASGHGTVVYSCSNA